MNSSIAQRRLAAKFNARQLLRPLLKVGGILLLFLVAVILGGLTAVAPASFIVKLGFAIGGIVVLILSLLVPAGSLVPIALLRHLLLALAVLCATWPIYLSFQGLPGPNVNPTRLAYWSLIGLWLFWFIASGDLRAQVFRRAATFRPFVVMLFIYLFWALISAAVSDYSILSVYYLIKLMVGPTLLFFIALSCLRDKQDVDTVLLFMTLAALFACAVGMLEAKTKSNLFYDLVPFMFPQADNDSAAWTEGLVGDKSRSGDYRVMATFSHPLTFGEYLAMSFPLAVYLAGNARYRWQRALGVMTIPAVLAGIYSTHTRSALLAVGVALVAIVTLLGLRAMRQRHSFAASVLAIFVLFAMGLSILALIGFAGEMAAGRNSAEAASSMARAIMLRRGTDLALDSPLFGYGPGFAAVTLGLLPGISKLTIDSQYLSVVLESGFPGLLLFLGLLAYPVIKGFRAGRSLVGRGGVRVSVIVSALISFAMVKSVLSLTENFDVAFLLIALLVISLEPEQPAATVNPLRDMPARELPKLSGAL